MSSSNVSRLICLFAALALLIPIVAAGRTAATAWHISTIETAPAVASGTLSDSIVVDPNGSVHIAYFHVGNDGLELTYASNEGGRWTLERVAQLPITGLACLSLGVDSLRRIHISYGGPSELNYAVKDNGSWSITQLAKAETTDGIGVWGLGYWNSLKVDSNDRIHISFISHNGSYANIGYATNSAGQWNVSTVVSLDGSLITPAIWSDVLCTSIALDSGNRPHISFLYSDAYTNVTALYYAFREETGLWSVVSLSNATAGETGTSIVLDTEDNVHIAFVTGNYSSLGYVTNAGGSWSVEPVDPYDLAWLPSMAIDSKGRTNIVYHRCNADDLGWAVKMDDGWHLSRIDKKPHTGYWASIAVDQKGAYHVCYYTWNDDLKYVLGTGDPAESRCTVSPFEIVVASIGAIVIVAFVVQRLRKAKFDQA